MGTKRDKILSKVAYISIVVFIFLYFLFGLGEYLYIFYPRMEFNDNLDLVYNDNTYITIELIDSPLKPITDDAKTIGWVSMLPPFALSSAKSLNSCTDDIIYIGYYNELYIKEDYHIYTIFESTLDYMTLTDITTNDHHKIIDITEKEVDFDIDIKLFEMLEIYDQEIDTSDLDALFIDLYINESDLYYYDDIYLYNYNNELIIKFGNEYNLVNNVYIIKDEFKYLFQ